MENQNFEKIYSGYPTEEIYRKNLVSNINKTSYDNMKSVCSKLEYILSPYDLIRLANKYKSGNKSFNEKVEYLLTDLNFHSECSMLMSNQADDLIDKSKEEIQKIIENYVLNKFIVSYMKNPENHGYISIDSNILKDVSEYDCKFLQSKGYISPISNGYELTDYYIQLLDKQNNSVEL